MENPWEDRELWDGALQHFQLSGLVSSWGWKRCSRPRAGPRCGFFGRASRSEMEGQPNLPGAEWGYGDGMGYSILDISANKVNFNWVFSGKPVGFGGTSIWLCTQFCQKSVAGVTSHLKTGKVDSSSILPCSCPGPIWISLRWNAMLLDRPRRKFWIPNPWWQGPAWGTSEGAIIFWWNQGWWSRLWWCFFLVLCGQRHIQHLPAVALWSQQVLGVPKPIRWVAFSVGLLDQQMGVHVLRWPHPPRSELSACPAKNSRQLWKCESHVRVKNALNLY